MCKMGAAQKMMLKNVLPLSDNKGMEKNVLVDCIRLHCQKQTDVIYLNFSKYFDTVSHSSLSETQIQSVITRSFTAPMLLCRCKACGQ